MKKPEIILVINAGSSSLKFTLYSIAAGEKRLASGLIERIGTASANMVYKKNDDPKIEFSVLAEDHTAALKLATDYLTDAKHGVIASLSDVDATGHRILHGGEIFKTATMVTPDVIEKLKELVPLGPLHMPANIGGVEACREIFPGAPIVAIFDTAFHQTMPDHVSRYAIPNEYYEKFGIRKFGFHGTSHKFVSQATAKFLGRNVKDINLITCHLGNGSSLAAIKNGKVYDTTMGLTPLAGLVMGTRCGDLDPAVVLTLMRLGMSADEIDVLLNNKSGLYGVGNIQSGDMRDMINHASKGVRSAQIALDMWAHRIVLYIGGYSAHIGGADAIVFTGGIGENSFQAREKILVQLGSIGCHLDREANNTRRGPCTISTSESTVAALVIPTNEELMIAQETVETIAAS